MYRNNSRRKADHWKTEIANINLYRALPNDIGNVDLSKLRHGSGYQSSERKGSANNPKYTNRSNKSRHGTNLYNEVNKIDGYNSNMN